MNPQVISYAGSTYPEHPRSFSWEGEHYTVQEILQRRREPERLGFLVRCAPDDSIFDLIYFYDEDRWDIHPKGPIPTDGQFQPKPNTQGE